MLIYEKERSNVENYIYFQKDDNLNFPLHVHTTYELVCVIEGTMNLTINQEQMALSENDCALIFPNQVHAYETVDTSKSMLCVFSSDLIDAYHHHVSSLEPIQPLFRLTQSSSEYFDSLMHSHNLFQKKSLLYHMVAMFDQNRQYQAKKIINQDVISRTLQYIEQSFLENITLQGLSETLGYDYNYTSSLFNRVFQVSFIELVNRYRLQKAMFLLKTTKLKISDISMQCGFHSHRAFNRTFLKHYHMTPTEYRIIDR